MATVHDHGCELCERTPPPPVHVGLGAGVCRGEYVHQCHTCIAATERPHTRVSTPCVQPGWMHAVPCDSVPAVPPTPRTVWRSGWRRRRCVGMYMACLPHRLTETPLRLPYYLAIFPSFRQRWSLGLSVCYESLWMLACSLLFAAVGACMHACKCT